MLFGLPGYESTESYCKNELNILAIFQAKMPNVVFFHLLKCEGFVAFLSYMIINGISLVFNCWLDKTSS